MKRWIITYQGSLLPFDFETESYGDTEQEAIDYAVKTYQISRSRIISCQPKQQKTEDGGSGNAHS